MDLHDRVSALFEASIDTKRRAAPVLVEPIARAGELVVAPDGEKVKPAAVAVRADHEMVLQLAAVDEPVARPELGVDLLRDGIGEGAFLGGDLGETADGHGQSQGQPEAPGP